MSFFFTCVYVVFLLFRPQDWLVPQLAAWRPLDVAAGLALAGMLAELLMRQLSVPRHIPHLWLMLGLFGAVLASHAANTYLAGMVSAFQDFGKTALVFLLVLTATNSVRRLRSLTLLCVAMALVMGLHCLLQTQRGWGLGHAQPLVSFGADGRIHRRALFFGIFADPNDTALFLVGALPLVLAGSSGRGLLHLLSRATALGLLTAGVYATQSRGGFLAFAVMLLTSLRRLFAVRIFLIAAGVGVLLLAIVLPSRLMRLGLLDASATDRTVFWGEANQGFRTHPLFGVGYGMVREYIGGDRAAHNSYVQAYVDLGLFGYAFWLGLMLLTMVASWQLAELEPTSAEDRFLVRWATFAVPSLAGLYAAAYFLSRTYHTPLFVFLAMCAAAHRLAGDRVGLGELNRFCGVRREYIWIWPFATVGSIVFIYGSILVINRVR